MQTDLKISFWVKSCSRQTYPEVCAICNREQMVQMVSTQTIPALLLRLVPGLGLVRAWFALGLGLGWAWPGLGLAWFGLPSLAPQDAHHHRCP